MGNQETDGCVEIFLICLDNSFVPFGQSLVYSEIPEVDALGREARTGYGATVPVELYGS